MLLGVSTASLSVVCHCSEHDWTTVFLYLWKVEENQGFCFRRVEFVSEKPSTAQAWGMGVITKQLVPKGAQCAGCCGAHQARCVCWLLLITCLSGWLGCSQVCCFLAIVLTYREGVKGIEASRKEEGSVCKPERVTWRSGFDVSDTLRVL